MQLKHYFIFFTILVLFAFLASQPTTTPINHCPPLTTTLCIEKYLRIDSFPEFEDNVDSPIFPLLNYSLWYNTYEDEIGHDIIQMEDGGFAICTYTGLARTNAAGQFLWYKSFLSQLPENFTVGTQAFAQCSDGGFIISGRSWNATSGTNSAVVIRTDEFGTLLWYTTFTTQDTDCATSVVECDDGGFFATISSSRSCQTNNHTTSVPCCAYLLRLANDGTPLWNTTYGDTWRHWFNKIIKIKNDGFAIVGFRNTTSIPSPNEDWLWLTDSDEVWVVRLNSNGNHLWDRTYAISTVPRGNDEGKSIVACRDGGFAVTGSGNWTSFWLRISENGTELGRQFYQSWGGQGRDIVECESGGFAIVSRIRGYGIGLLDPTMLKCCNEYDVQLIRTNETGHIQWDCIFGFYEPDWVSSLVECEEGGFAVTGVTNSYEDLLLLHIPDEIPPRIFRRYPEELPSEQGTPNMSPYELWATVYFVEALIISLLLIAVTRLYLRRRNSSQE